MEPHRTDSTATRSRRPARDIIDAVVDNMRKNLEPLKYSTLAASRYTVYLHPSEYTRLEGIVPILRDQTVRALTEELQKLNRGSRVRRWIGRSAGRGDAEIQKAGSDWHVDFVADPDGDMGEGDLLVDSELVLPSRPDLGVGERTRRVTTVHEGPRTTTREQTVTTSASESVPNAPVRATIGYEDDRGQHSYDVVKESVTVGRGGIAYPVDIRIASSPDVSREHARIRRDEATGRFFLIDLSSLGTTLNGRHVPRGYDEVQGGKRENGAETAVPDVARIGLADTVFLDFRKVG
jgi:pSer/pThr/pTyr-binding forkhead associated (FHA) protein